MSASNLTHYVMPRSSRYASLLAGLVLAMLSLSGCGARRQAWYPPIIETDSLARRYHLQLDLRKTHTSGLMIVQRAEPQAIRLVCMSYFGLSLFDFTLTDSTLVVHQCIEPMRHKRLLRLLERDLRHLFMPTPKRLRQTARGEEYAFGGGLTKGRIRRYTNDEGRLEVEIHHPYLAIALRLTEQAPTPPNED